MSFADAVTTLRTHFTSGFDALPYMFTNDAQEPDGNAWILFDVFPTGTYMSPYGSTGKRVKKQDGVVMVHIFIEKGADAEPAFAYADTIATLFEMKPIGSVQTYEAAIGHGSVYDDDERWFRVSVSVPFSTVNAA